MTALEAADHSLLKWEGLRPANLKKHKVSLDNDLSLHCAEENTSFYFDAETCSLCKKYLAYDKITPFDTRCLTCPVVLSGGINCFDDNSPFMRAFENKKIQPMINTLRNSVVWILENDVK